MKLGNIEAAAGSKAFGSFLTGETHGQFPAHIPLHIVNGAAAGPTLVVQAGASGLEIEPSLILPHVVKELDAAAIRGALILVPLMNTSGFEFTQVNSAWDDKHLNRLGRGEAGGSISQQMVHQYYQTAIANADALLDIRTGSQWSYHHFAGVYSAGDAAGSRALAVALGLPQVVLGLGADESMAYEAATDGKLVVAAHIGGGPGLRDYRDRDLGRMRNAVLNAMRHLDMLDGALDSDSDSVTVLQQHSVITPSGRAASPLWTSICAVKRCRRATSWAMCDIPSAVRCWKRSRRRAMASSSMAARLGPSCRRIRRWPCWATWWMRLRLDELDPPQSPHRHGGKGNPPQSPHRHGGKGIAVAGRPIGSPLQFVVLRRTRALRNGGFCLPLWLWGD